VFTEDNGNLEIVQSEDYYPYGLKKNNDITLIDKNAYQFNGIEHIEGFGLGYLS